MHNSKNKNFELWFAILLFGFCILNFTGCATIPTTTGIPTYHINGISYLPLTSLCTAKGINLEYDTFTRTAVLTKGLHKINLHVGDNLILVDSRPQYLKHPVDIYQGIVVVPYKFKEQIIDTLFKEYIPTGKITLPLAGIRKVVVDAGHGGNDPGAIGRTGLREKTVTLDIARRLSKLLKEDGINVVMTRSTDNFIRPESRINIANKLKADLFLSIHANANRVRSLSGFEVYYVSPTVSDSQRALSAAQEASPILDSASVISPSLNLKATLWDMIYTYNRAESIELARSICRTVNRNLDTRILGVKAARFYVLKGAQMPAILIEVGFLSNAEEERLLKNNYYRQKITESIRQGFWSYAQDLAYAQANQ